MIKFNDVTFSYESGKNILENINFTIEKGKKTVFLGENGSGKSTIFSLIEGILKPKKGEIFFENKKIKYNKKSLENLRKNVGIVFQDPEIQIFAPLVFQEIAYGLENIELEENEINKRIDEVVEIFEIENLKNCACHQISYGQKKRVSIASILAMKPSLLILDEPMAWLDVKNSKNMSNILEELNKNGKTLVVSTHNIDFAYEFADYIYVLDKGKIIKSGNKNEIFNDYEFLKKMNLKVPTEIKIKEYLKTKNIDIKEYYEFLKDNNLI